MSFWQENFAFIKLSIIKLHNCTLHSLLLLAMGFFLKPKKDWWYVTDKISIWTPRHKSFILPSLQDVYDDRSAKMVEVMDKCEKSVAEVRWKIGDVLIKNDWISTYLCLYLKDDNIYSVYAS